MQRPGGSDAVLMSVAVLAVATSGPLMAATAAPALAIAFWRNALGSAVVVPAALLTARSELRALDGRERKLALVSGVFLALHFATWVPALDYTTVASATALVATQPVWVALIARQQGVHVSSRVWAGIGVAMAGALLLTGADLQVSGRALVGDLLAVAGGMFAAAYMTAGSAVRRSVSTTAYTALCYSTCAVLLLVVCVIGRQELSGYDGGTWLKLLAITAGAQLLGHSLFNVVLRSISPTVVSLSILLEIPGAALIAAVFLGQRPPLLAIPAAMLLLAGLALVIRDSTRVSVPVE
ncbi:MAG: DMT family transporter [Actinobacteria bacterium]|nr:DMT family transporter [Actinomycetota bacterium]MCA1722180.1 DMT family transporter [Actinomycetota bacterium]